MKLLTALFLYCFLLAADYTSVTVPSEAPTVLEGVGLATRAAFPGVTSAEGQRP